MDKILILLSKVSPGPRIQPEKNKFLVNRLRLLDSAAPM